MLQKIRQIPDWQRTLYILFFAQLVTAIGFSSIFPFLPLFVESLGTNTRISIEFWAGAVFSSQAITMAIASPLWGMVADRYGRKLMMERALFGGVIIIVLMGFARSAEELVLLRAIQGTITGTVSAANALIASVAPKKRMGYAMGMIQVSLWGGISIGPLIGGVVADMAGYRAAFWITAALLLLGGICVHWGINEQFTPSARPKGNGFNFLRAWKLILSADGVLPAYALRFLSNLSRMLIVPIAPLFILTLLPAGAGVNTYTGIIIGIAAGAGTLAAVYLGRLGDNIGHRRVLIGCALAAALLYIPQAFVQAAWQLLILQALTGFFGGGTIPAISALLSRYSRPGEEGTVFGLDNSVVASSRGIAPLLGSAIAFWVGYRAVFTGTGIIFVIVALVALLKLSPAVDRAVAQPSLGD